VQKHQKSFKEQIRFLVGQLHNRSIDEHQFMKLMDMAYKDYLEFYPEERQNSLLFDYNDATERRSKDT
jgi:hypothetical protein